MKNQLLTYFAAIAIVVAGCQKEQLTQNSSNISSNQSALRDDERDTSVCTVDFCNGVVVFNDTNEYLDA